MYYRLNAIKMRILMQCCAKETQNNNNNRKSSIDAFTMRKIERKYWMKILKNDGEWDIVRERERQTQKNHTRFRSCILIHWIICIIFYGDHCVLALCLYVYVNASKHTKNSEFLAKQKQKKATTQRRNRELIQLSSEPFVYSSIFIRIIFWCDAIQNDEFYD